MQTIFSYALPLIEQGADFSIDFATRSMKLNKKFIIKNGKPCGECKDMEIGCYVSEASEAFEYDITKFADDNMSTDDVLIIIQRIFSVYRCSRPSSKSTNRRRYFQAIPLENLSHNDLLYGKPRELYRFFLEFFVLKHIIDGTLKWYKQMGSWHWRSLAYPDLIILREWVEPVR